ncbi:MAG: NAD(P)/FAD-dependent oxidoreductase [Acidimicrobiales bacterium]|nr:NAD(P)/FAD-dependent oxidoreductase [Acidimicrobiales bacterium]
MMVTTDRELDAVVIGAGFSGLYMNYRLRDVLGLDVVVFEGGSDVGGTWYWNRYPGARCDSESYMYCFSFDPELMQEWEWSGKYPEQPEILRYLNHVADRYDLRRNTQFETRVTAAHFDETTDRWRVETDRGDRVSCRYLITGIGCLSTGQIPDFPGRDSFTGEAYHTGSWPHEGVDFTGKRVAVIGTGSSGIQSIPVIARQAEQLVVFQRTAQYTIPARHATVNKAVLDKVKLDYEAIYDKARWSVGGFPYDVVDRSALSVDEQERDAIFEQTWQEGGFRFVFGSFSDLRTSRQASETAAEFIRNKIRQTVKDPAVAEKLVPTTHPFGSKRTLIDTEYFETYNRDNVTLVDIRSAPITEITPTGIRTADGHYEVDIIVYATGFDAMTGSFNRIDIRGRGGEALRDTWSAGPLTYLGLTVAGFPTLFMSTGPGSPSVLSNMPVAIEQHVEYVSRIIEHLRAEGLATIEADAEAQAAWVAHVNELAQPTMFMHADSWYLGANIPGKPRVFMPYCGGVGTYRKRCDEVAANGWEGFTLRPVTAAVPA